MDKKTSPRGCRRRRGFDDARFPLCQRHRPLEDPVHADRRRREVFHLEEVGRIYLGTCPQVRRQQMVEGKITTKFTRLHSMVHHVVLGAHRPPRQHLAGLLRDDIITSIS